MASPDKIRILVVDDSVVVRSFLRKTLDAQNDMQVVGTASTGEKAIAAVERLVPDLVVMDIEMPELDGLTALERIRSKHPRLPAIIFTGCDEHTAAAGMKVFSMADTFWQVKPRSAEDGMSLASVAESLLGSARMLVGRGQAAPAAPSPPAPPQEVRAPLPRLEAPARSVAPDRDARFELLAIGSSTGGPDALTTVLSAIPGDLPVPVVVVQHMPAQFTRFLAERLDARCALTVAEAAPGMVLSPGHVYIAPGGYHMELVRQESDVVLTTNQGPPEHSCRPAVDPMFRSAAAVFGGAVLATVLTGMGRDGCAGCAAVRAVGGRIVIQDEATSVVWGMPGEVYRAGLAHDVLPLPEIAAHLVKQIQKSAPASTGASTHPPRA